MISKTMHGNFTGVQLDQITSLKISKDTSGFTRTSFRVIGGRLQKLELILQLKAEALLILSSQEIEGRIVQCSADVHTVTRSRLNPRSEASTPSQWCPHI